MSAFLLLLLFNFLRSQVLSSAHMQDTWSNLLETELSIAWQRARFILVGEGRAGKTALGRALRNLPFLPTASTAGVATDTVETTDMHQWTDVGGAEFQQVNSYFEIKVIICLHPDGYLTHTSL